MSLCRCPWLQMQIESELPNAFIDCGAFFLIHGWPWQANVINDTYTRTWLEMQMCIPIHHQSVAAMQL